MSELSAVHAALKPIPSAGGIPVLGFIPQFARDPLGALLKTAILHGPVVRLDLAGRRVYLISHPTAVKYVLQDNNRNYSKGYHQAKPLMGEGLVTSEGEFWRSQRRLIQPSFNRQQIAHYTQTMTQATEEFIPLWDRQAALNSSFNIAEEMMRLTQTIIVRTMFSSDIGGQADALGKAFDQTLEHLNQSLFSPHPLLQTIPTPANLRHKRALRFLDAFVYGLIEKRRGSAEDKGDLLSRLLLAEHPETGERMPDQQIRDELMTIFLAGHETTANALAWTWYLLGQNPQVEERLLSEVDNVLGGRPPVNEDIPSLVYGEMVFAEALRLYPPAWLFARHADAEDRVMDYRIPAGAMLFLSPYVTQHHPEYWDDPERFDPERFSEQRKLEQTRFAYFPFGGGPRQCIGNHFSQVEALLIMTRMLQRYRIRLDTTVAVKPTAIATLQPRPGVFVRLERR